MKRIPGNILAASLLCLALFPFAPPATAEDAALGASLDELLAYARQHNPELAAQRLEAEAARERIAPASALPDPKFQVELMDFTNAMSGGSTSLLPGEVARASTTP